MAERAVAAGLNCQQHGMGAASCCRLGVVQVELSAALLWQGLSLFEQQFAAGFNFLCTLH
jgi:hypothetical protein